jgi:hypothetical protein
MHVTAMRRIRMLAGAATAAGFLTLLFGLSRGCGSQDEAPAQVGDTDAGQDNGRDSTRLDRAAEDALADEPGSDAEPDGSEAGFEATAPDGDAGCPPFQRPSTVPPDWEEYTDWSCGCRFYIAGAKGQMPPPIQWEPCPPPAPQNIACERMKPFWTTHALATDAWPRFALDVKTGAALIAFSRMDVNDDTSVRYRLVAEADGKVRLAFVQANPKNKGCEIGLIGLSDNRFALYVIGTSWSGSLTGNFEGLIAGDIDDRHPPVKFKLKNDPQSWFGWTVSSAWIVQIRGALTAHSWDLKSSTEIYSPATDPEGMPAHNISAVGGDVFWGVDVQGYSGVMSWDAVHGARPLLRWYGDWTRGAGNFRTDGKDMVWTYGEGRDPSKGSNPYAKLSVMTAPHTTDPVEAQGKARRLRSDTRAFSPYPFGIGCGHAVRDARLYLGAETYMALLIVRLADGGSWVVKGMNVNDADGLSAGMGLGASCQHAYFVGKTPGLQSSIYRIRLDSLGPPLPPD